MSMHYAYDGRPQQMKNRSIEVVREHTTEYQVSHSNSDIISGRETQTGKFLPDISLSLDFLELCRFQPLPPLRLLFELLNGLELMVNI